MVRQRQQGGGALTIPQVCEQLNVTRHTVYSLIERGELAAFVIGKRYRVEPQELQRYKERHRVPARTGDYVVRESGIGDAPTPAVLERVGGA